MFPIDAIAGIDQRGNGYASFLLDPVGGAWRAIVEGWCEHRRLALGPAEHDAQCRRQRDLLPPALPVEKGNPNSGGAGKFRGGNAAEIAYVVNDSDSIMHYTTGGDSLIPGPSLYGGDPTSRTRYLLIMNAHAHEEAARNGRMPAGLEELGGEHINVSPKTGGVVQQAGDIFSWRGHRRPVLATRWSGNPGTSFRTWTMATSAATGPWKGTAFASIKMVRWTRNKLPACGSASFQSAYLLPPATAANQRPWLQSPGTCAYPKAW